MRKPPPSAAVPMPGEGKRGAHGHLGYLLRQASVALRTRMERELADLGVTQSHSRPHVSNDNPYSEAQFKT